MMDRRLVENFDWAIIFVLMGIIGVGLLSLYSALWPLIEADPAHNPFIKQLMWLFLGFCVMFATLFLDYQRLKTVSFWVYAAVILLLVLVLVVGREVNGSKRWLNLFWFQLQPSELMKVAIVLQLSAYFSSQEVPTYPGMRQLFPALGFTALAVILVLKQPDLGTGMCIAAIAGTVIFFAGIRWRYLAASAAMGLASIWPVWHYVLKDYQKARILTLLRPDLDPLGAGYHIRQSKIAIGSGMGWGKGFLHGTQTKLHFLPEKHTDFIFSVWAEEWGFLGSILLLVLFGALIALALRVARRSKDRFGALIVVGMTALLMWQAVINIGMVIGLMPVVGITLPFVSYGGSSLITMCFAIGVIENVSMRRFVFHSR